MGLGNILLGDEGVGVHALRLLEEEFSQTQITFYDGGTRGIALLPFLEEASKILLLDAVQAEASVGTLVRLSDGELSRTPALKFSAHDISLPDLMALLSLRCGPYRPEVHFLGLVPARLDLSLELSGPVQRALPLLIDRARRLLKTWLNGERAACLQHSDAGKPGRQADQEWKGGRKNVPRSPR